MKIILLHLALLCFFLSIHGCDLFSTRDPEPPSQHNSTFLQPVTAEIVLDNLKNAVTESNADNYYRCFVDSASSTRRYEFIPAVEISAQYPGLFSSWTPDMERSYFRNLEEPVGGAPYLTFSGSHTLAVSSDSVVYAMDYTVFFPHRRAGISLFVQGNMQLYLAPNSQQLWSIYRWQDYRTVSDSTWSYWKATFSGS